MKKRNKNSPSLKWLANVSMSLISLIALFPIIILIISSFRPSSELLRSGISLTFDWSLMDISNYTYIFTQADQYWQWYMNSLAISAITVVLSLFFSSMVGYALAVYVKTYFSHL